MNRKIIVTIDCEDELCWECKWRITGAYSNNIDWCDAFSDNADSLQEIVGGKRLQRCLDAEVRP